MQEFLYPLLSTAVTAFITWFLARRKNNADAKSAELDAEIKAAKYYQSLLEDLRKRLDDAIKSIEERDEKIEKLIRDVETLTEELRKYKQLNGKTNKRLP